VYCDLAQVGNRGKFVVDKEENVYHGSAGWVVCGGPLLRWTGTVNGKGDAATPSFEAPSRLGLFVIKFGFSAQDAEKMIRIRGARDVNVFG